MPALMPFQPSIGAYRFSTQLEDVPYIFDVRWNARAAAWYFDLYEQDGTPIVYGVRIVLGLAMGRTCLHPLFRGGQIVAYDSSNQGREATFDDLGTRVVVWYFTQADLAGELSAATDAEIRSARPT